MRISIAAFLRQLDINIFSRLSFKFSFSWSERTGMEKVDNVKCCEASWSEI